MRILLLALAFTTSPAAAQSDSLMQRVLAAERQFVRGEREEAMRAFDAFIDIYNQRAARLTSRELVAVAIACTYLGADDPQLFRDALKAYDEAISMDPRNIEARVRLGELFLAKYNGEEAKRAIAGALSINRSYVPALIAEARRRDFDHEPGADSILERAVRVEPESVAARTLRARFRADVEAFDAAIEEIDRALKAAPEDPDALSFSAAVRYVTGDSAGYEAARSRFTTLYPRNADIHVEIAELLSRVRQYGRAAEMARLGTQTDTRNWRAHAVMGNNLLRLGRVDDARRALETAFAGDPYDVWTKNTLDLLDTFDEYALVRHGQFEFMLDTAEADLMQLYLADLSSRAFETLRTRYGFRPSGTIRMEVYRRHADFSVRTVGLSGLGALGVSFGNTVAFDSPAARDMGNFNWASTAWHELAHTFTLGASDQRVPRWLSEGLSVYEERRARKGWGQGVTPAFLRAYSTKRLYPASRLNDGFVRPRYPEQVMHSYFQASLVCEMIAKQHGERALVDLLHAYRDGLSTEQAIRRVLRLDLAGFDRAFDAYMRDTYGTAISSLGEYTGLLTRAGTMMRRGDTTGAVPLLQRARAMFPEYGGGEGPYPMLVRTLLARGDQRGAKELLVAMQGLGEFPNDAWNLLADLALATGDTATAADAMEGAMFVNPYDIAKHELLAGLYGSLGEKAKAVRERRAVVALKPVDRAEAYYNLAVAYRAAGDVADARRSVLRALEDAPSYERAQILLLELRRQP